MYKDLKETYKKLYEEINSKLELFSNVWKNSSEKELFMEIAFCILTPQSKAKNAWEAIKILSNDDL
ncbi:MAG: DNA lyase, partial [Fusobacteria bacterium]|nr:DNA lyase [Fusobacteriota bacterium]